MNDLLNHGAVGVENAGSGTVVATGNWWGCAQGPGSPGCSSTAGTVISSPFLVRPVEADQPGNSARKP